MKWDDEYVKIITPGEPVDTCYGLETIELEPEHINALMEGKQIYTTINCDEYAIIIKMHSNEESEEDGIIFNNLCNSCSNIGCEFQSGIVRTKCAFYMPPHIEPDNCGNYITMHQQS